jgi:hypothetical protein
VNWCILIFVHVIEVLPDFHNIRYFKLLACQSVLYKYIVGWNGVEDKEIMGWNGAVREAERSCRGETLAQIPRPRRWYSWMHSLLEGMAVVSLGLSVCSGWKPRSSDRVVVTFLHRTLLEDAALKPAAGCSLEVVQRFFGVLSPAKFTFWSAPLALHVGLLGRVL